MICKTILSRIFTPVIILSTVTQLKAQQPYSIQGTLAPDKQGKIMLIYTDPDNKEVKVSAEVKNGSFIMKGSLAEPVHAELELNPDNNGRRPDSDAQDFFLDPGKTTVISKGGVLGATITGGQSQIEFTQFMKELKPIGDQGKKLDSLYHKYNAEKNDDGINSLRDEAKKLAIKRTEIQKAFVKEHPDSYVAFSMWAPRTNMTNDLAALEPEFNRFSPKIRNSVSGKIIAGKIADAKKNLNK